VRLQVLQSLVPEFDRYLARTQHVSTLLLLLADEVSVVCGCVCVWVCARVCECVCVCVLVSREKIRCSSFLKSYLTISVSVFWCAFQSILLGCLLFDLFFHNHSFTLPYTTNHTTTGV